MLMNRSTRSQFALGLVLILVGAWFLATRMIPDLGAWAAQFASGSWPVVFAGGIILLIGLLVGAPGMAIPASIVAGIGGILVYIDTYGHPQDWSFLWTLIPGFVGLGIILEGLLGGDFRDRLRRGVDLLVTSGFLFLVFAALTGNWNLFGEFGPAILLIVLGVFVLVRGLVRTIRRKE